MLKWRHMNPNNPLDYLNQIAPQQPKRRVIGTLRPLHYVIGGIIIVLGLVLIIGLVVRGTSNPTRDMQHLVARLQTTATIANNADKSIKDGQLSVVNSNLEIYLTNTNRDIAAPFKKAGVGSKIPKDVISTENGNDLSARLEDARLNAVFDSTYAREMAYQLSSIMTLMKKVYQSTDNKDVKTFLETAYNNLQPTEQSFSSFKATTEY